MDTGKKAAVSIVLLCGIVQWAIILERFLAALWDWYKFSAPFGGGGHITVGLRAQIVFYVSSGCLVLLGWFAVPEDFHWRAARKWSIILITAGVASWTAILLSPLAVLRH